MNGEIMQISTGKTEFEATATAVDLRCFVKTENCLRLLAIIHPPAIKLADQLAAITENFDKDRKWQTSTAK